MKQPSQRQLRVSELIRHAISDILVRGELRDPTLDGVVITIPEIRMSPDLKIAEIFVMPLGGTHQDKIVTALTDNRKRFRGLLAKRINLKYMPDVRFHLDNRFDEADKIDVLLNSPRVKQDLERSSDEDLDESSLGHQDLQDRG